MKSFFDSEKSCIEKYHSHLASIPDGEILKALENHVLISRILEPVWIGTRVTGYDQEKQKVLFEWIDETPNDYQDWDRSALARANDTRFRCGTFYFHPRGHHYGTWTPVECRKHFASICKVDLSINSDLKNTVIPLGRIGSLHIPEEHPAIGWVTYLVVVSVFLVSIVAVGTLVYKKLYSISA